MRDGADTSVPSPLATGPVHTCGGTIVDTGTTRNIPLLTLPPRVGGGMFRVRRYRASP